MLNQVVLVGRLTEIKRENEYTIGIELAVPRSFKNEDGIYDTDYIKCMVNGNIAKNTEEYCKKGYLVGIKGRVQAKDGKIDIIAEKITFLSSKKVDENND